METIEKKAMKYVWNQLTDMDKAEIDLAIERAYYNHTSIEDTDDEICERVADLLDEYGQDNELQEDWWLDYGDKEKWIFDMLDLCKMPTTEKLTNDDYDAIMDALLLKIHTNNNEMDCISNTSARNSIKEENQNISNLIGKVAKLIEEIKER